MTGISDILAAYHAGFLTQDEARRCVLSILEEDGIYLDDAAALEAEAERENYCAVHGHQWQGDTAGGVCAHCGTITIDRAAADAKGHQPETEET